MSRSYAPPGLFPAWTLRRAYALGCILMPLRGSIVEWNPKLPAKRLRNVLLSGVMSDGQTAVEVLDGFVAFAGGGFQRFPVLDFHSAAQVLDGAGLLKNAGRKADAGTPSPQHLGQEFMRDGEKFRVYAVLAHEQPAREALFDFVQAIACSNLRDL